MISTHLKKAIELRRFDIKHSARPSIKEDSNMATPQASTESIAYGQKIIEHASNFDSVDPGPGYAGLASFLQHDLSRVVQSRRTPRDNEPFLVVHDLNAYGSHMTTYESEHNLRKVESHAHQVDNTGQLVFLRGWLSPDCIKAVGARFSIDPELFRRHLHYQNLAHGRLVFFEYPPLPSFCTHIFDFVLTTICHRSTVHSQFGPEDLQGSRQHASNTLAKYHRGLPYQANVGDTIVQNHSLLSREHDVIEQKVSVQVKIYEKFWRGKCFRICLEARPSTKYCI